MNQLKTVLLLGLLSGAFIAAGSLLGPGYAGFAAVLAVALNVGAYFFSDKLVLRMHGARELSPGEAPGLRRLVEELSARAGLPMPRLFVMQDPQPNAFATGRDPAHGVVAVTTGLLGLLDERELRGVIAHELAHIKNRDILLSSIAATVAAAVTYLAHAAGFAGHLFTGRGSDEEGPGPLQLLLLALVAPLAATLIQLGISRSREYEADRTGARIAGDSEGLARALLKLQHGAQVFAQPGAAQPATASLFIVNPLTGAQGLMALFSTHPQTEERVRRLRALGGQVHALS
ncbi:M48 family metalloprotease [Aggregicoccus sp. 17bor-14]|uniref:M48 family metalloprotease n=1 Tax=Myxococcaceae TaxID=31 RepID=UPI00129C307F|nr:MULTISPECIES: M48 family metalloprotease [Myxococcaceae]MBF5046483.1 M48 family metalloprotease [Simulacricoccus sp. 17bor-14]MRI92200.1 M48 family metalloprotease [Aggregicoccus sp. 17bor-14]